LNHTLEQAQAALKQYWYVPVGLINAFIEGWAVRIYDNTTGSLVRKDDPLATFYNPDLPATLQTFYYSVCQKFFPLIPSPPNGGRGLG